MKKGLCNLALLLALLTTSLANAENTEDLHDMNILKQHFDDSQNFAQWYNQLNQEDKDLVLAGTVYACYPNLTKVALTMNGNINTKLLVTNVTSGHDKDSSAFIYAYSSGDTENFMMTAITDSMRRTAKVVKKESCGHTFATMGSKTPGLMTLISATISSCKDEEKNAEMLQLLKEKGLDINETNDFHVSPLSEAIQQKNIELVEFLLQNGANFSKTFALSRMIDEYYSYESDEKTEAMWDYVTAYLKEHKLSQEASTDAYIQGAISYDDEIKAKLNTLNLQPNYNTVAAKEGILAAANRENYDLLRELVDNGVDVNYKDKYGRTALFYIANNSYAKTEDIDAAKYLLSHGADVNIKDKNGKMAFDDCAYKMCQLNPNGMRDFSPDDKSIVPTLNQALDDNDCSTIVNLIKNGIDPFVDVYGTALFFRLYHQSNRACLKDVLELGIDLNKVNVLKDSGGKITGEVDTALTYANRYFWSKDLIPLLKQYGAVETDDIQRVARYNEMWDKYKYNYYEQAITEIEQKLEEKNLKDWEVEVYKNLLKKQEIYKRIKEEQKTEKKDFFW